ncbi:MAG: hypothetical protein EAZ32_17505 [Cytophagia bacterium]|nr:MAG: hypothetical protein EAZ38_18070 [Cytophagales bacterium]TAG36146.1 MAG: hypothetical protein EAZ32_17505 [Cytophagia bacterium]
MTATISKTKLIEVLHDLPEEIEVDDVVEHIMLLSKLERARKQIDNGEFYSMQEIRDLVKSWQK